MNRRIKYYIFSFLFLLSNCASIIHHDTKMACAGGTHATTHQNGGNDSLNVGGLSGLLADPQTPTSHTHAAADVTGTAVLTNDSRLSDSRTPLAHSHAAADVTGTAVVTNDSRLSDARTPTSHASSHKAGGGDIVEAFPVGAVFISVVSTNPNTLLGYGTWSAIASGRVLVGLNSGDVDFDTVEETGGEKTHVLTAAEMPVHTHIQDGHAHSITDPGHTHSVPTFTTDGSGSRPDNGSSTNGTTITIPSATTGISISTVTATNQNAGSGSAHNNVQPYYVVYMWKRTA